MLSETACLGFEAVLSRWKYLFRHPAFRRRPATVASRLLRWRILCALGCGAEIVLDPGHVRLKLPPEWRGVAKLLYAFRRDYEPELTYIGRLLRAGMVAVDAGASYGVYALTAAVAVGPCGMVLAFEPSTGAHELLVANAVLNNLANVHVFRAALADRCGTASLYVHPDPSRNSLGGSPASVDRRTVETFKLDCVLRRLRVKSFDLLKLDVEGAEELVLRGAMDSLSAWCPPVVFEINPTAAEDLGLRRDGAWSVLSSLGYRFYRLDRHQRLRRCDQPRSGNIIALR